MDHFAYRGGQLLCDGVAVADLAREHGTPLFIYSEAALRENVAALRRAFAETDPLICYALKANYSLAICNVLQKEGCGFDIVSGGELFRVLKAGADPKTVVYAGVGKTRAEIQYALQTGILFFNVESRPELDRINDVAAELGVRADVVLRVNPDVDAGAHQYTTTGKKGTKFGIELAAARTLVAEIGHWGSLRLVGLHIHLGSPICTPAPYAEALERIVPFVKECREMGARMDWLDIGGGYGIEYKGGETAGPGDYAAAIVPYVEKSGCRVVLEPGRFLVGNAAVMVTRVQYVKDTDTKTFAICDAGMNDFIRPALYDAYHRIWPVRADSPVPVGEQALADATNGRVKMDVVGPVCESGDFLAKDRLLPQVGQDDLLAVFSAGAYTFSMSSNYNSRLKACEVMISDGSARVIRTRQSYEDLIASEKF